MGKTLESKLKKMCRGKATFTTIAAADAFLIKRGHDGQRPYLCPVCQCFHLTTNEEVRRYVPYEQYEKTIKQNTELQRQIVNLKNKVKHLNEYRSARCKHST